MTTNFPMPVTGVRLGKGDLMPADPVSQSTFRRLLLRSVLTPLALLGVLAAVFLVQIMFLLSAAHWVNHTDQVIAHAHAVLELLVDGETGMRGYLVTGDPAYLEPYHVEQKSVGTAFEGLIDLVSDNPFQVESLKALRRDHNDWQVYARKTIDLRREGGDYQSPVRNGEGKRRMDAMRGQIADVIRVEEELRDARTRTARQATWVVVGGSLSLALLLGGVLAFFTRRQLLLVSASYRKALSEVEAHADSLRKAAHRLETLHEIDRAILAAASMPELACSALCRMEPAIPSAEAFVVLFGANGEPARVISRSDLVANPTRTLAGVVPSEFSDRDGLHSITDLAEVAGRSQVQDRLFQAGQRSCLKVPLKADGRRFGVLIFCDSKPSAFSVEHERIADEIARQLAIAFQQGGLREELKRHAEDLEKRVEERTRELQEALDGVKQLQGLLPICAWCKKVRDDKDYWHEVEHYVTERTDAQFTHGICPDCLKRNMVAFRGGPPEA